MEEVVGEVERAAGDGGLFREGGDCGGRSRVWENRLDRGRVWTGRLGREGREEEESVEEEKWEWHGVNIEGGRKWKRILMEFVKKKEEEEEEVRIWEREKRKKRWCGI